MLIGIVADIHDAVEPLARALALLRDRGVERIVTLGDAFDSCLPGEPGAQVARLLQEADATGVWGNHDFGLSREVPLQILDRADPAVLGFAARLQPQLAMDECRFSHIEPWKDPCRLEDLWDFDGVPDTGERAQRSFQAVPERVVLLGHFHCRLVVRREGPVAWDGPRPITLSPPERFLVLVPAVVEGWCATYETGRCELTAIRCMA